MKHEILQTETPYTKSPSPQRGFLLRKRAPPLNYLQKFSHGGMLFPARYLTLKLY
jgi:hypothetical protein